MCVLGSSGRCGGHPAVLGAPGPGRVPGRGPDDGLQQVQRPPLPGDTAPLPRDGRIKGLQTLFLNVL